MSFWNRASIEAAERAAAADRLATATRDDLVAEIVALRAAAHPILTTLSGLDLPAERGVGATSKLFPSDHGPGPNAGRLAVYDEDARAFRYEPPDPGRLHALDYAERESIGIRNAPGAPPALHDDVCILRVAWEGIGGGGPAGEISMGDVRALARAMAGPGKP